MAAPIIWGLAVGTAAVVGWLGKKVGGELVQDVDTVGDVVIAGAAGWLVMQALDSPAVGLGAGVTMYLVLRAEESG
ncbi:hypothetical protein [Tateyamaria sp.]|uniref:hypothetical protein n=1 Tax=Tateyamaria sp. TaxID=1929288 RepID=UPI003B21BB4E